MDDAPQKSHSEADNRDVQWTLDNFTGHGATAPSHAGGEDRVQNIPLQPHLYMVLCANLKTAFMTFDSRFMRQRNIQVLGEETIHWGEKCAQEDPVTN